MNSREDHTVDELRRESERNRAELAVTVRELREKVGDTTEEIKTRVSPTHLKNEVRSYIRDERDSLMASLEQKARDNPLQTAAIGAAVAYPLFGLLRAIPTPLLLIGAGLWLTGKQGRRTLAQAKTQAAEAYEEGTAKASEYAASLKAGFADQTDGARATAEGVAGAASARMTESLQQAGDAAAGLRDTVSHTVSDALNAARERASEFADSAADGAARLQAGARTSGSALTDFVKQNPLLVAGIGAAAGAFIAAAIPSSAAENRLFGATSSGLKRKARDAAAEGFDKAKEAAAGVAANVAMAAAREGLNEDGLRKAADAVVGGVKAVAQRGVSAAMAGLDDGDKTQHHPTDNQNQARKTGATHE